MSDFREFNHTIDHIPEDVLKRLSRGCILVAKCVFGLQSVKNKKAGRHDVYVNPCQQYIAARTGLSRQHVSRCFLKLEVEGVFFIKRVRSLSGKFRVNWYRLGQEVIKLTNRLVKGFKIPIKNHATSTLQVAIKDKKQVLQQSEFDHIIANMKLRFGSCDEFCLS